MRLRGQMFRKELSVVQPLPSLARPDSRLVYWMDYQWKTEILWAASELRSRNRIARKRGTKTIHERLLSLSVRLSLRLCLEPDLPPRHFLRVFNTHLHRVFDTMVARFLADLFAFLRNEAGKRSRRCPRLPLLPSFLLRINNLVEGLDFFAFRTRSGQATANAEFASPAE